MSPTSDNHIDADIEQCKADILRAKSLIPPFGKPPTQVVSEIPVKSDNVQAKPSILDNIAKEAKDSILDVDFAPAAGTLSQKIEETIVSEEYLVQNEYEPAQQQEIEEIASSLEEIGMTCPQEEGETSPSWMDKLGQEAAEAESEHRPQVSDIPTFNLAEQIMAEQRKVTANKRRGPANKTAATEFKPPQQIKSIPSRRQMPQDKMLAQIVARDINRLMKGIAVF